MFHPDSNLFYHMFRQRLGAIELVLPWCEGACHDVAVSHGLVLAGASAPGAKPREAAAAAQREAAVEVNKGLATGLAL